MTSSTPPFHSSSLPSSSSSVPLFHSLGNGTVEQDRSMRNTSGNNPGTETLKSVPPPDQLVPFCRTNLEVGYKAETDNFLYDYEERAAIAEYDGQQTPLQSQRIAYLDAFISVLVNLPQEDPAYKESWLEDRIRAAKEWLQDQNLFQPK